MSVLIMPLPDGDALIMTKTLTLFLRYVQVINISSSALEKSHIIIMFDAVKEKIYTDQLFEVLEQLLELGLVYKSVSEKYAFPKINVICAFQSDKQYVCRSERYKMEISKETFVRIQEELLAKHLQTPELEELKRQNMLMRAHIEFSPDGPKFLETLESFKTKAKG